MQLQEGGFDWMHAISALGGAVIGAVSAAFAGIWRVARIEPDLKEKIGRDIDAAEHRVEAKVDDMTGHFHEYFEGIRRQQDDLKLSVERDFVRKDDFKEFREEWRQETRDMKRLMMKILGVPES